VKPALVGRAELGDREGAVRVVLLAHPGSLLPVLLRGLFRVLPAQPGDLLRRHGGRHQRGPQRALDGVLGRVLGIAA